MSGITDPIANMLVCIKNAGKAKHKYVCVPASNIKIEIARVLQSEGFVHGFRLIRDNKQGIIKIALKYNTEESHVIKGMDRVSKSSLRVYRGIKEIHSIRRGLGIAIMTTSKGIMTNKTAKKENVGGEILAYIW
jgi:small subunit ribosomal protein S8